ncbi:hypothetical protein SAMN05216428_105101 [Nitrosospira sp. Nsp11]|nr:hypothetical protein SAMN05216428_105101 [Nitrosospira sp. Nsp11]
MEILLRIRTRSVRFPTNHKTRSCWGTGTHLSGSSEISTLYFAYYCLAIQQRDQIRTCRHARGRRCEVADFILKSGSFYFSLEVPERGYEYGIVVVMDGNGLSPHDDLHHSDTLFRVPGSGDKIQKLRSSQMQQCQIYASRSGVIAQNVG